MEPTEKIPAEQEIFTKGTKTETVEEALASMKELFQKYEALEGNSEEVSDKRIKLNLYEFPKMIEAIKSVDTENVALREKGEAEFDLEKSDEYKRMAKYGLKYYDLVREGEQKVKEATAYAKTQNI